MLRNGSTGEEVTALQKTLMAKGINPGPIDGVFGPKTEDAVRRFQERSGLEADGIVGPKTFAALEGKTLPPPDEAEKAAKKAKKAAKKAKKAKKAAKKAAAEPEEEPKEIPEQPDERDIPRSAF